MVARFGNRVPRLLRAAGLAVPLAFAAAAHAEIGANVTLQNDDRFRGYSTSNGRPVATANLAYDDVSGPYAGGSVSLAATRDAGARFNSTTQFAGYALALSPGLALDAGAVNRIYSRRSDINYAHRFAELYLGLVGRRGSARLSFAPRPGGNTLYAEGNATLIDRTRWSLGAHVGLLIPHYPGWSREPPARPDWRLTLATHLGRFDLAASYVGTNHGWHQPHEHDGVVLSATCNF